MVRVFSLKHSSTSVSNVGINTVSTKSVYQKWQSGKTKCFAGVSQEGLTRKILVKTSCLHPILTLRIPIICRAHASLRGMLTHELPTKTLQSSMAWVFTPSLSHTQPLQINLTWNKGYKRLNRITIKFDIELKPTKHKIVNYNFTFWKDQNKLFWHENFHSTICL